MTVPYRDSIRPSKTPSIPHEPPSWTVLCIVLSLGISLSPAVSTFITLGKELLTEARMCILSPPPSALTPREELMRVYDSLPLL